MTGKEAGEECESPQEAGLCESLRKVKLLGFVLSRCQSTVKLAPTWRPSPGRGPSEQTCTCQKIIGSLGV